MQPSQSRDTTKFSPIGESSQNAIIGRVFDRTITSWNIAAERIYGCSVEEAMYKHFNFYT